MDPAAKHVCYGSFTEFLGALRLSDHPSFIGDTSVSPLAPDAGDIYYHRHEPRQAPRRWRKPKTVWGLPSFLADAYAHHDGGRVIFNHLPPQIRNPYGDLNAYPKSTDWAHVFRAIG